MRTTLGIIVALVACTLARADEQLYFGPATTLSVESPAVTGGAVPGGEAFKVKLVRLFKTPMGVHDDRLVIVYGDANHDQPVWHPRSKVHLPKDIFVRYSDDDGATWSDPVNVSNTARAYSSRTDWDGDGVLEEYWGDSAKPNIFNNGDNIVVTWTDKYCPEETWNFGDVGQSSVQGEAGYPDLDVYPNERHVPYSGVYAAISNDGGTTWTYGDVAGGFNPPLQLTYGRRDAIADLSRGNGPRWVMTWQEDPEGLQPGDAEGPGEGSSGAKTTKGTDIWYAWTADIAQNPQDLRLNRAPLTDHSAYDTTSSNGYPFVGVAGSISNHGASRPNLGMVKEGTVFKVVLAYEETKGIPDIIEGKTVQLHVFPFDAPVQNGSATSLSGSPGAALTGVLENSRRVRFVLQAPNGVDPAIAVFWRQGVDTQGAPSDVLLKCSTSLDQDVIAATPTVNLSSETPDADAGNLLDGTQDNPYEDARAHRALLRGPMLILGYTYTWNGPLARYTDLANYNFYLRRSLDGGATWLAPQNVSNIHDTTVNVLEPRLVGTPKTGTQDDGAMILAWGTETNVYDGFEESSPLDIQITRSFDQGATFDKVVRVTARVQPEFESQLRPNEDASQVYAVWNREAAFGTDALGQLGTPLEVPATVGTMFCFGNGAGSACPCGNESAPDAAEGCANSTGAGAVLTAGGSLSAAADDLTPLAMGLPPGQPAVLVRGDGPAVGGYGNLWQDGLLCLKGGVRRLTARMSDATGAASWGPGLGASEGWMPGDVVHLQVIYRDGPGPCGQNANATTALEVGLAP